MDQATHCQTMGQAGLTVQRSLAQPTPVLISLSDAFGHDY
jgi:hypothetical protein